MYHLFHIWLFESHSLLVLRFHQDNMSVPKPHIYIVKMGKPIFLIYDPKIDCGYSLEPMEAYTQVQTIRHKPRGL